MALPMRFVMDHIPMMRVPQEVQCVLPAPDTLIWLVVWNILFFPMDWE